MIHSILWAVVGTMHYVHKYTCHFHYIKIIMVPCVVSRDGVSTIQMYSSTSTITLNMHEYEYSENKCVRVRLLYNILEYEYDYFRM